MLLTLISLSLCSSIYTGTWTRYVPLKNSSGSGGDIYGYLEELKRTNQTLVGLGAASCEEVDSFVAFLDVAAKRYPALSMFASLSSHAPAFEYCPHMLNDLGDDVNWTRVGQYLGNATGNRTNFRGIYIDDFYVIMCTPDKTTYVRHGSPKVHPCLQMDAMVAMKDALRKQAPRAQFMPLVYNDNLGYALPGAHGLGAPSGVRFVPPAATSATFSMLPPAHPTDKFVLRFFYKSILQAWERGDIKNTTFIDIVRFRALVNDHLVLDVDAANGVSVEMFKQDVTTQMLNGSGANRSLRFEVIPTAKAATTSGATSSDRCTFVFGLELRRQSDEEDVLDHHSVRYAAVPGAIAQSSNASMVLDVADAIIVQQAQPPAAFVADNYTELMTLVLRQATSHKTAVIGGHYARLGLRWRVPVSATQLADSINIDRRLGLSGALVWNEAVELSHCPAAGARCTRGVFAERSMQGSRGHRFDHQLMWPDRTLCLPGWFARYQTSQAIRSGDNLTLWMNDELKQKGNRTEGLFALAMFFFRVYGTRTNHTYYQRAAGYDPNSTCVAGGSAQSCPGTSIAGVCRRRCTGVNGAQEQLNLSAVALEPIAVSLSAGRGCSHTLMVLRLGLAGSWVFESNVDDGFLEPSLRAIYNATLAGFAGG